MKKVKCLVVIGYMMILLGSVSSISLITSSAKYVKEDLYALNYGVKFKDLSSNYTRSEILNISDAYTLYYGLSFQRQNNMEQDDWKETFRVQLDNSYCKIESVEINNKLTPITNSKISFTSLGEDQVDMTIRCNLQDMVDHNNLKLTTDTYGSFNDNDDFNYLFATDTFQIDNIIDYYNKYGWPNQDSCDLGSKTCRLLKSNDESDMYERLIEWLGETTKIADDKKTLIRNYLKSAFLTNLGNKVNDENIPYFNTLDGLNARSNEQYYIFEVDDNFGSYAVTDSYYRLRVNDTSPIDLYFYQEDDVDNLFIKYVSKYLNPSDIKVVSEYLKKKESEYKVKDILDLIEVDPRLGMLTYNQSEQKLSIPTTFYSIIAGEKLKYSFAKTDSLSSRVRSLRKYLNNYIDPAWTELVLYQDGNYSYIVNCTNTSDDVFDHYTYVTYEGESLLLHIFARNDNTSQIYFEEQYITGNTLNFTYDITTNTNVNIKSDLNSISQNIKKVNLELRDQGGNAISITDNTLVDGTYQSNIGTVKITTQSGQRQVVLTLS